MKLSEIFNILYIDNLVKEEYFDIIENLKINTLLEINKEIAENFILIISKNIIYTKKK